MATSASPKPSTSVSRASLTKLENLTKEQYNNKSLVPRNTNALSISRDTLNPQLNAAILKQRLQEIEFYKYRFGVEIHRWPHFLMQRVGKHVYKYKGNYLVKGLAAYMVYSDVQHYRYMRTQAFLSYEQEGQLLAPIVLHSAFFTGLCLLI